MDLPVKLVELQKHADVDGKKLTWDLQVNASAPEQFLRNILYEGTNEITLPLQKILLHWAPYLHQPPHPKNYTESVHHINH
jgi:hypothetical protein